MGSSNYNIYIYIYIYTIIDCAQASPKKRVLTKNHSRLEHRPKGVDLLESLVEEAGKCNRKLHGQQIFAINYTGKSV